MRPTEAETHILKHVWQYGLTTSALKWWRQEDPGAHWPPSITYFASPRPREPDYKARQTENDYCRQSAVPTGQSLREASESLWSTQPSSNPLPSRLKLNVEGVGRRKTVGVRGGGGCLQANSIFRTQQHWQPRELTQTAAECTGSNQGKSQHWEAKVDMHLGAGLVSVCFQFFFLAFGCFCLLTCLILEE